MNFLKSLHLSASISYLTQSKCSVTICWIIAGITFIHLMKHPLHFCLIWETDLPRNERVKACDPQAISWLPTSLFNWYLLVGFSWHSGSQMVGPQGWLVIWKWFWLSQLGRGRDATGTSWVEAKDDAKYPTAHRKAPEQGIIWLRVSTVETLL